jgi:hypothetical protein
VANDEHLAILRQGVEAWNEWRERNADRLPDLISARLVRRNLADANLSGANLIRAQLIGADLKEADLSGANLWRANLSGADLRGATLSEANLNETYLPSANLAFADLSGADLRGATLREANLSEADLSGTNFTEASLSETILADVDLTCALGLDKCFHGGPSVLDFRTLSRSGDLPINFLRGCGLPDTLIEYLPSLRGDAIRFYSCFISYSAKDQVFADRLYADLQNRGVRCWFAPHDLRIGAKTWDAIDEAIRLRDKLLVILSKASLASDWVDDEVAKAFAEERLRKDPVLFPIRIDNAVMDTGEPWAVKLRDQRNIGDFRQWKNPEAYQKSLDRLLRDLKTSPAGA